MKKKDIALIVTVGILNAIALTMAIAWKYWFSLIACVICAIMYLFVVYHLIKGAKEEKQQMNEDYSIDAHEYYMQGMCDACGQNHKAENSQLCKECQQKIEHNEKYKDWW